VYSCLPALPTYSRMRRIGAAIHRTEEEIAAIAKIDLEILNTMRNARNAAELIHLNRY
jgi:hypothetical protein